MKRSRGEVVFEALSATLLIVLAFLCVFPMVNTVAVSLSSSSAASAGLIGLLPVDFTLAAYQYALSRPEFLRALTVTLARVAIGVPLNMSLIILTAYPLSKDVSRFRHRTAVAWYFVLTMLFGGGLIPFYMTIRATGLLDTIWALVIPGAVPIFDVVLLLNFFRGLPKELEDAAFIDGAGHWTIMRSIYVPLSLPALATIALFTTVGHWNAWFDGLIFMNNPIRYPLQSYLQTVVIAASYQQSYIDTEAVKALEVLSDRSLKAAQIFLGAVPILAVYPFLQRYFMKGIVMGSVKE